MKEILFKSELNAYKTYKKMIEKMIEYLSLPTYSPRNEKFAMDKNEI